MALRSIDLMIGDWVEIIVPDKYAGERCTIESISQDYLRVNVKCLNIGYYLHDVFKGDIKPIPLTSEILEKNGWEERKEYEPYSYYLLTGKEYSVSLSKGWDSTTKTIYWSLSIGNHRADAIISVDYVHQLQHALRLCGIDKEITL